MKLTKQQIISLKLAQWLGCFQPYATEFGVAYEVEHGGIELFNPFANTTEGRAQFAECVIKAAQLGHIDMDSFGTDYWHKPTLGERATAEHDSTSDGVVTATLEAIFYAIGGDAGDLQ